LDAVDALLLQAAHSLVRFVFAVDDDTGALAPKYAGPFGRRPIDDIGRGPNPRPADAAVTHAFPLRDDPIHRVVGDIRARDHTIGKVNLSHPVAIMTVSVN